VDLEHFKRYNPVLKNSALFTYYDRFEKNRDMPLEIAKKEAKERNLTLIVIERDKWGRFQYPLFPRFLELFDYYIDARISHSGASSRRSIVDTVTTLAFFQYFFFFSHCDLISVP
ncbi:unnamed protein product, partial [marine sediment metagenome]